MPVAAKMANSASRAAPRMVFTIRSAADTLAPRTARGAHGGEYKDQLCASDGRAVTSQVAPRCFTLPSCAMPREERAQRGPRLLDVLGRRVLEHRRAGADVEQELDGGLDSAVADGQIVLDLLRARCRESRRRPGSPSLDSDRPSRRDRERPAEEARASAARRRAPAPDRPPTGCAAAAASTGSRASRSAAGRRGGS